MSKLVWNPIERDSVLYHPFNFTFMDTNLFFNVYHPLFLPDLEFRGVLDAEEREHVLDVMQYGSDHAWTLYIDSGDSSVTVARPGIHPDEDVVGYVVTQTHWVHEDIRAIWCTRDDIWDPSEVGNWEDDTPTWSRGRD